MKTKLTSTVLIFIFISFFSCGSKGNLNKEDKQKLQDTSENNQNKQSPTTVLIGSQTWTTQNLGVTTYRNGDIIPQVQDPEEWKKLKTGAWCYYENKSENGVKYGKLYNGYAVVDSRGLAPEGWHIPTADEWKTLIDNTYGQKVNGEFFAGKELKSDAGWENNKNGTNSKGFSALPGGYCTFSGGFRDISKRGYWWTSTILTTSEEFSHQAGDCNYYLMGYDNDGVSKSVSSKTQGYAVRCVKD